MKKKSEKLKKFMMCEMKKGNKGGFKKEEFQNIKS